MTRAYCRTCGCPLHEPGRPKNEECTPDDCWCDKQPDVGDWHATEENL